MPRNQGLRRAFTPITSSSAPATGINWNQAARFINWLNVSTGHSPAYRFAGILDANEHITLWSPGEAGYDPANPFRNSDAYYFLPSENEWYRAAYFDPTGEVYWNYATGSDSTPTQVASGTDAGTAVWGDYSLANANEAGGLSPFGTMAQNGNVWEFMESGFEWPNDSPEEDRVIRGGSWQDLFFYPYDESTFPLSSAHRRSWSPLAQDTNEGTGFRIASIPEPCSPLLSALGLVHLLGRRRR